MIKNSWNAQELVVSRSDLVVNVTTRMLITDIDEVIGG